MNEEIEIDEEKLNYKAENPDDVEILHIKNIETNRSKDNPRIEFLLVNGEKKVYEGKEYKYLMYQACGLIDSFWYIKEMTLIIKTRLNEWTEKFERHIYRVITFNGVYGLEIRNIISPINKPVQRVKASLSMRWKDLKTIQNENTIYIPDVVRKKVWEQL